MGRLPSSKYQFNHPYEPHQAIENLAWLVDALLCFCLLKSQLETTCKGDPNVLGFTFAHSAVAPAPHHPQTVTLPTHSQTDTINVVIHCSSVQHESIWFPKCSQICSGCDFDFFPLYTLEFARMCMMKYHWLTEFFTIPWIYKLYSKPTIKNVRNGSSLCTYCSTSLTNSKPAILFLSDRTYPTLL